MTSSGIMNRPYIYICSVVMGIMLMVPSTVAYSQESSDEVLISTVEPGAQIAVRDSQTVVSAAYADSLYIQGDYLTAINMYEEIISNVGVSASIYMNLGNAYYKLDEIAKAILCYERAYLLDPSDDDIRFNLELARSKTVDKVSVRNRMFLGVFFDRMANMLNISQWSVIVIVMFVLTMILGALFVISRKVAVKKVSFYLGLVTLVLSVLSYSFASIQKGKLENRNTAIIMEPSVTVKSTPSKSGTDLFIIHEGHKVDILDSSMKEWVQISLEDGNSGWIQYSSIEII